MANFDSTKWYQITIKDYAQSKLLSFATIAHQGVGSAFFQLTNTSSLNQQWQLYESTNQTYVLRSGDGGPTGYLVAQRSTDDKSNVNTGNTVPAMLPYNQISDNSMFWSIQPWGDGSFWMENLQNGSRWHLEKEPSALMTMSSNITGTQPGQQFIFEPLGKITDAAFSTLSLPSSPTFTSLASLGSSTSITTASSSPPSQTSDSPPSSQPTTNNGLSTGAQAAIGATIGCLAFIASIIGLMIHFRRRKAEHIRSGGPGMHAPPAELSGSYAAAEMEVTSPGVLKGQNVELPHETSPVELDSGMR